MNQSTDTGQTSQNRRPTLATLNANGRLLGAEDSDSSATYAPTGETASWDCSSETAIAFLELEPPDGFEPSTPALQVRHSGQLSYRGGDA